MNCGRTRRRGKFYFNDLEIIRQMTRYFCDRNCNICLHEHPCKGEGAFCFMTFLSHVYLGGEDKSDITWYFLGCEPAVLFLIGKLYYYVFTLGT